MNVHKLFAVHIPEIVALSFADYKVDSQIKPFLCLAAVPIFYGFIEYLLLRCILKDFRYVHKNISFIIFPAFFALVKPVSTIAN
ncbi:MAG: hypothetical protein LUG26_04600, partial [Ruminococcus sp.]|nr:hypothetical protein [Ruminococcus sp.]